MTFFRNLFLAVRFLTILPLPQGRPDTDADIAQASCWFPLVGFGLGAAVGYAGAAVAARLGGFVGAAAAVALLALLTGALHLDGLADSFDGLFGGRDPTARLRIMKDHAIGAYGLAATVLVLLLKVGLFEQAALGPALGRSAPEDFVRPALAFGMACAVGRWMLVVGAASSPYAREGGGAGRSFMNVVRWRHAAAAAALLAVPALLGLLDPYSAANSLPRLARGAGAGLRICLPAAAAGAAFIAFCRSRIGGMTGDTLGALCELAELAALAAAALARPCLGSGGLL